MVYNQENSFFRQFKRNRSTRSMREVESTDYDSYLEQLKEKRQYLNLQKSSSESEHEESSNESEEEEIDFSMIRGMKMELIEDDEEPIAEYQEKWLIPQRDPGFVLPEYFYQSQHPLYQITEIVSFTKKAVYLQKPENFNEETDNNYFLRIVDKNGKDAFVKMFLINDVEMTKEQPPHFDKTYPVHYTVIPYHLDFTQEESFELLMEDDLYFVVMKCTKRTVGFESNI